MITSYGGERGEQDSVAGRGDEQEGQEVAGPVPRKAPIGPVMPTAAVLAQAQKATADLALQVGVPLMASGAGSSSPLLLGRHSLINAYTVVACSCHARCRQS